MSYSLLISPFYLPFRLSTIFIFLLLFTSFHSLSVYHLNSTSPLKTLFLSIPHNEFHFQQILTFLSIVTDQRAEGFLNWKILSRMVRVDKLFFPAESWCFCGVTVPCWKLALSNPTLHLGITKRLVLIWSPSKCTYIPLPPQLCPCGKADFPQMLMLLEMSAFALKGFLNVKSINSALNSPVKILMEVCSMPGSIGK